MSSKLTLILSAQPFQIPVRRGIADDDLIGQFQHQVGDENKSVPHYFAKVVQLDGDRIVTLPAIKSMRQEE